MGLLFYSSGLLCLGIKESSRLNGAIVVIKVLVLLLFIFAGIGYMKSDNFIPFVPPNTGTFGVFGFSGVIRGAGKIFFAFIGFDAVRSTLFLLFLYQGVSLSLSKVKKL
jgi:APA family basic amino acid/polyamine antiporter